MSRTVRRGPRTTGTRDQARETVERIDDLLAQADAHAKSKADDGSILFTDSAIANLLALQCYRGSFRHASGLGWLRWDGKVWRGAPDKDAIEAARQWAIDQLASALADEVAATLDRDKSRAEPAAEPAS